YRVYGPAGLRRGYYSYEHRLETIFGREVNRVHVLDFAGLTDGMRQNLADRLSMIYTRDDGEALFTSHAWRRLFEVKGSLVRDFILEFLSTCRMGDTEMGLDAAAAGSPGATEDAPAADEAAQAVSAPVQAPQPPPLAPQHRNMSQRIDRLEEEVREMRLSIVGLREVVKSSITEQTRVSTWMIRCMMQLMDASGRTYQAFDSTLVSSSWLSYQRLVRSRRDDAGTSIAPHINDQPDP
nr:hypothetical protein [Tanacetum cinerariifolium]